MQVVVIKKQGMVKKYSVSDAILKEIYSCLANSKDADIPDILKEKATELPSDTDIYPDALTLCI